jgi:hypothetical protein
MPGGRHGCARWRYVDPEEGRSSVFDVVQVAPVERDARRDLVRVRFRYEYVGDGIAWSCQCWLRAPERQDEE